MRRPLIPLLVGYADLRASLIAACGVLFIGNPASAQSAQGRVYKPEIVVTARRERERQQDIPGSVAAATGDELDRFLITDPTDISKLVPGLTFSASSPGEPTDIFLRGARWTATSGLPTIPTYINEAAFYPLNVLRTVYDIEQVEVLRGTQGTVRGEPSVAGAITFTIRKPDLEEIGGYASGRMGDGRHRAVQSGLNLPIVEGLFAIRLAGSVDDTSGNRVRSVNNPLRPFVHNRSWRVSARLEPTPSFRIDAMYQRLTQRSRGYQHVAGPGAPGIPALGVPSKFNSPAISEGDRLAVQVAPNVNWQNTEFITVNASWDVLEHKLEYNFGLERNHGFGSNTSDPANILVGFDSPSPLLLDYGPEYRFLELRLSSSREERRFLNYDIGIHSRRFRARGRPSITLV